MPQTKRVQEDFRKDKEDFRAWFLEESRKSAVSDQSLDSINERLKEISYRTALAGWMATVALGVAVIGTLGILLLSR